MLYARRSAWRSCRCCCASYVAQNRIHQACSWFADKKLLYAGTVAAVAMVVVESWRTELHTHERTDVYIWSEPSWHGYFSTCSVYSIVLPHRNLLVFTICVNKPTKSWNKIENSNREPNSNLRFVLIVEILFLRFSFYVQLNNGTRSYELSNFKIAVKVCREIFHKLNETKSVVLW